ncbi:flagellar hook-length control protein FliK [Liquorilactobacillus nagelii]|uniref:flagellar hook-length control protein FliK n=1 Tax=Liquorilactobacillus nagelii TaxID=82688 RepID=UPI0039EC74E6
MGNIGRLLKATTVKANGNSKNNKADKLKFYQTMSQLQLSSAKTTALPSQLKVNSLLDGKQAVAATRTAIITKNSLSSSPTKNNNNSFSGANRLADKNLDQTEQEDQAIASALASSILITSQNQSNMPLVEQNQKEQPALSVNSISSEDEKAANSSSVAPPTSPVTTTTTNVAATETTDQLEKISLGTANETISKNSEMQNISDKSQSFSLEKVIVIPLANQQQSTAGAISDSVELRNAPTAAHTLVKSTTINKNVAKTGMTSDLIQNIISANSSTKINTNTRPSANQGKQELVWNVADSRGQTRLVSNLTKEITTLKIPESKTVTIKLSPENLGNVEITMKTGQSQVSLAVKVQNTAAKELLGSIMDKLEQVLQNQPYSTDGSNGLKNAIPVNQANLTTAANTFFNFNSSQQQFTRQQPQHNFVGSSSKFANEAQKQTAEVQQRDLQKSTISILA